MPNRQFTLRIDADLYSQISKRAALLNRSVNKEIEILLAYAIDHQIEADEKTCDKIRQVLAGNRKDTSALDAALASRT